MNKTLTYSAIVLATLFLSSGCSQSSEGLKKEVKTEIKEEVKTETTKHVVHTNKHWGYKGDVEPAHWSELNEKFHMCSEGQQQSPIDVIATKESELPRLKLSYTKAAENIINNGHAVQVNIKDGNILKLGGVPYTLKQFHFHTPSENLVNGKSFPLEAHFVHVSPKGNLAVISVMFEEGTANAALNRMVKQFPLGLNQEKSIDLSSEYVNVMLPVDTAYYKFMGSLTTPPCSEQVKWFVIKKPLTASKAQIDAMHQEIGQNNNRPVQPSNGRTIDE